MFGAGGIGVLFVSSIRGFKYRNIATRSEAKQISSGTSPACETKGSNSGEIKIWSMALLFARVLGVLFF